MASIASHDAKHGFLFAALLHTTHTLSQESISFLVNSDTHCTNPEVKMAMPKWGGLDPEGWEHFIGPNLLEGFAYQHLLFCARKYTWCFSL